MGKYQWFTDDDVKGLDDGLCQMLSIARGKANVPFIITCGVRTPEQNQALVNSVSDSSHLTGHGVDLECADSVTRFAMLKGLLDAGFKRVGVYEKHLHADNSTTLPQQVCWYVEGS